jgi:hypothetical protein
MGAQPVARNLLYETLWMFKSMESEMKYRGQRWLRIGARTVHLISVMFVGANAVIGQPLDEQAIAVLVASGMVLVGDDVVRYGSYVFRYLHFWAAVSKISLLSVALVQPEWTLSCLIAAVVVGSVISHAPGAVRHWSFVGEPGPCAKKAARRDSPLPSEHPEH